LSLAGGAAHDLVFASRRTGGCVILLLDLPYFAYHLCPLVEQLHDLVVNGVDPLPRGVESLCEVRAGLREQAQGRAEEQHVSHRYELYQSIGIVIN
jgi:hypothetical protein